MMNNKHVKLIKKILGVKKKKEMFVAREPYQILRLFEATVFERV